MPTDIWLERDPPIQYKEWSAFINALSDFREVDEVLALAPRGNLLHLADSQNHWYWLGHPQGEITPFSYTQWGIYVGSDDEATLKMARTIATMLGASLAFKERRIWFL